MDRLLVTGGTPLDGTVEIAGAKNSALKLMAAVVLSDEIDRDAARARAEQAQARLAQGDDASARAELAKALARTNFDE